MFVDLFSGFVFRFEFPLNFLLFSLILEMNYLWVVIFDQVNFDLCSDKKIFRQDETSIYVKKTCK